MTAAEPLRSGLTTGTCAAAATKAAALALRGEPPSQVSITLPDGAQVVVDVAAVCVETEGFCARASIRKDAGDDPDTTNGMVVEVSVTRDRPANFVFVAGEGVGTVTKPGLQIPPGEAAINPVPRRMMARAFEDVFPEERATLMVSVPGGREKSLQTFNPKLGIVGGISILGTSGRVIPRSEEAWLRSLLPQIDMALALGHKRLVLTPGSFGAALRTHLPPVADDAVLHAGNFIGDLLLECGKRGASEVMLAGHAGKLVKVAAGIFNTHSRFGDARLETVAALAAAEGASPFLVERLLGANTTEEAHDLLQTEELGQVWDRVAQRAAERATRHAGIPVTCAVTNYRGELLGLCRALRQRQPRNDQGDLTVVGVGPGAASWVCPLAWKLILGADVLVGGERHLDLFARPHQERVPLSARLDELVPVVEALRNRKVAFLASGDPGCFGLLEFVRRRWPDRVVEIVPGISSFQMAASRLKISWENIRLTSVHGRPLEALRAEVQSHPRLFVLTDRIRTPEEVASALVEWGVEGQMAVLENLGYDNETVTRGTPRELALGNFDALSVVYLERRE